MQQETRNPSVTLRASYKQETINGKQETRNLANKSFKLRLGFTLIELLIVISIFAITTSLITASYLTFERNQRLKAAAQKIKTDLRFAQNEALSGNKGVESPPSSCIELTATTLVGYYMELTAKEGENEVYTVSGYCSGSNNNFDFNVRAVSLSRGVKINLIKHGGLDISKTSDPNAKPVIILFRPLAHDVTFWNEEFSRPFDDNGQLLGGAYPQTGDLTIELCREKTPYFVIIRTTGEVYESQQLTPPQQECTA